MGNKPSCHEPESWTKLETAKKTVFESCDNAVYRIPALFYERKSKKLLAFAEQRKTADDSSAEKLVMKTGTLTGKSCSDVRTVEWSELKEVKEAHLDGYRSMNPCPVYEKTSATLFLFFICVEGTISEGWQKKNLDNRTRLCYITSQNLGQSWSELTDLTTEKMKTEWATFAVGPGHGLQTKSGKLIIPAYAYVSRPSICWGKMCHQSIPYALNLYSDDKGITWKFGNMLQNKSLECEMAEVSDDTGLRSIYCNARSTGGYRVEALGGNDRADFISLLSAKKLVETGGGCQGSVVSFPTQSEDAHADGDTRQNPEWLLFTHPSNNSKRVDLGVYLNKTPSDPKTWSKPWIINSGPSGYSDLAYIGDGWFACLMECGKHSEIEQIAFVAFNYNKVKQGIGESQGSCISCM